MSFRKCRNEQGENFLKMHSKSFILKAENVASKERIEVCRDPDDNKFIECAVAANALYIVSGDKDLLDLKKYRDVRILTAAEFLEIKSPQTKR